MIFTLTGQAHSPGYGQLPNGPPNGPPNGLPGQPLFQTSQQPRLLHSDHSRSASSTPPMSSMANQLSRPGSAPPTTGPQLASPIHPPSHAFGIHSSPPTPSGSMPTTNNTYPSQSMLPPTGSAQNVSGTSRLPSASLGTGPSQSVRPSPWQAPLSGHQPGLTGPPTNLTGPPTNLTGPPTSLTGPPTNLTGPPTNLTGPPTNLTGPPTNLTGPPTNLTGSPSSLSRPTTLTGTSPGPPTSLNGPPSNLIGQPTTLNRPPTNLTGAPSSLTGPTSSRPQTGLTPSQVRPSTTPTGQMTGSTGQPLVPPGPQSPSVNQGAVPKNF